jgi:pimeloyl-ACP methyl ester carboxylesterase
MFVVDELTRRLGISQFDLVGTSSGGTVAFRYAADHPDRVLRLVLINCAGMPRTTFNDPNRARGSTFEQWFNAHLKTRAYWAENITHNFGSSRPSPELIEMVYDMNRREGGAHEALMMLKNYHTGGPEKTLARIKAPTLIMWGMNNPTVMHLEADVFSLWLTSAPSLVKKYPHAGHYLYLEIPDETAKDIGAFLRGDMDADLRVTQRLPVSAAAATGQN